MLVILRQCIEYAFRSIIQLLNIMHVVMFNFGQDLDSRIPFDQHTSNTKERSVRVSLSLQPYRRIQFASFFSDCVQNMC